MTNQQNISGDNLQQLISNAVHSALLQNTGFTITGEVSTSPSSKASKKERVKAMSKAACDRRMRNLFKKWKPYTQK